MGMHAEVVFLRPRVLLGVRVISPSPAGPRAVPEGVVEVSGGEEPLSMKPRQTRKAQPNPRETQKTNTTQ